MSQFNIYFTRQDQAEALERIRKCESKLGAQFDWKALKRAGGDTIATLVDALERQVCKVGQCAKGEGVHIAYCANKEGN